MRLPTGGTSPGTPRRSPALLIISLLAVAAAIVGCGSRAASSSSAGSATANQSVAVTGTFGASPKVTIPKVNPGPALFTKTLIKGSGTKLTASDSLIGNFALYDWSGSTSKLVGSTYTQGGPTLFAGQMLPGLETALIGQKTGGRVLAVIPPKDGFGASGNSQIGVKGTDTLVFVIDLDSTISNKAGATGATVSSGGGSLPTVTEAAGKAAVVKIPSATPPKALVAKTLIKGTGAKVANGDYVVVQYTGVIWRTGKVFDSSWSRLEPFAFNIGAGQVVKGWDKGLLGQTVGSRVLLAIPPADGYGSSGNSQAGIKATDTIVFVVDIVGSYKPTK